MNKLRSKAEKMRLSVSARVLDEIPCSHILAAIKHCGVDVNVCDAESVLLRPPVPIIYTTIEGKMLKVHPNRRLTSIRVSMAH